MDRHAVAQLHRDVLLEHDVDRQGPERRGDAEARLQRPGARIERVSTPVRAGGSGWEATYILWSSLIASSFVWESCVGSRERAYGRSDTKLNTR